MTRKVLAFAWAAALAACAVWLWRALPKAEPESGVFALMPPEAGDDAARDASRALREEAEKRFLTLVVDADPERAARAADAYAARLAASPAVAAAVSALPPASAGRTLDFFAPHRFALLTAGDRAALAADPAAGYAMALRGLYLPPGLSGGLPFESDPLGTFGRWLADRGSGLSGLAIRDGHLAAEVGGRTGVAVLGALSEAGRGSAGRDSLRAAFAAAEAAARGLSDGEVLRSGFVFHELAAEGRARSEMTSIGVVSAVLLLALLITVFRGIRATLLGFLPVLIGCLAATAALLWLWGGQVHLIAMVFGATIVGVAEDYGVLFIGGLYEEGAWDGRRRMATVGRSLFIGMLTSVAGYLALFFVPIPGLRQIGVFSVAGLAASWLTVALWYPYLSKGLKPVGPGPRRAAAAIARAWPRLQSGRYGTASALVLAAALSIWGCLRLRADDDVRLLYAQDAGLKSEQERVAAAVRLPEAGRFFLIRGTDPESLLRAEESLRDSLAAMAARGERASKAADSGVTAVAITGITSFVPSAARQRESLALMRRTLFGGRGGEDGEGANRIDGGGAIGGNVGGNGGVRAGAAGRLADELGTPGLDARLRDTLAAGSAPLTLSAWLADPVSAPFRHLLRDSGLILPLPAGLPWDQGRLESLARAAGPSLVFVDPLRDVTDALATLRRHVAAVFAIGSALIVLALIPVLKGRTLAGVAPAALGAAAGLGCLGFSGLPLNLAALLALALILGMGVDYGIFIQESGRHRVSALVAINLGAATNIIAFGMLAFSSTPALKAFGLVLAAGLGAAWLAAPCFAPAGERMGHAA